MTSSYVGSKKREERRAVSFLAAPAPMTAKAIIRDELVAAGVAADKAGELVVNIVKRLAAHEYHIAMSSRNGPER